MDSRSGLVRALRAVDYFTLAFGSVVGVGWLVVLPDWLKRGGPVGAMLAFLLGGLALLPIGYVYGRLTAAIAEAGGELAYARGRFPEWARFAVGWMMFLAYLVVCPYEAVAIGELSRQLFPSLESMPLYVVGQQTVYLPCLAIGLALVGGITAINCIGVRHSSRLQNVMTFGLLALFTVCAVMGFSRGSFSNLSPAFAQDASAQGALLSIVLVLQVVPYFFAGFEAVGKCAEERSAEFEGRHFTTVTLAAIALGAVFYVTFIAVVSLLEPWSVVVERADSNSSRQLPVLAAFEAALGSPVVIYLLLCAAILSLVKVLNGCLLTATRLLFAMSRDGLVPAPFGTVHQRFHTPVVATVAVGVLTVAGTFLGRSALVPISEVGSFASAVGWFAACNSFILGAAGTLSLKDRVLGYVGGAVALLMLSMKFVPMVPGSFNPTEWCCLAVWLGLGCVFWLNRSRSSR